MNEEKRYTNNYDNNSPPQSLNTSGNTGQHIRISQSSKLPPLNQIISDSSFNAGPHPPNPNIPRLNSPPVHLSNNNKQILNQYEDNNSSKVNREYDVDKDPRAYSNINNSNEYSYTLYRSSSGTDLQSSNNTASNGNSPNQQFNFRPIQQNQPSPNPHHQGELLKKRKYVSEESSQLVDKNSPSEYSSPINVISHNNSNSNNNTNNNNNNNNNSNSNSNSNDDDSQPPYKQSFPSPHNNQHSIHNSNILNTNQNIHSIPTSTINHHDESSSDDSIDSNDDAGYELLQHNNIANGLMIFQDALSTEEVYNVYNKFKTSQSNKQLKQQQTMK